MTISGQLRRKVTFQQRAADANGDRTGALADVTSRQARILPLKGSEAVQASRLQGNQPVIIAVRRDSLTKLIDNSYQAKDAHDATVVWDISSATVTEDLKWVEILAVQRKGTPA